MEIRSPTLKMEPSSTAMEVEEVLIAMPEPLFTWVAAPIRSSSSHSIFGALATRTSCLASFRKVTNGESLGSSRAMFFAISTTRRACWILEVVRTPAILAIVYFLSGSYEPKT